VEHIENWLKEGIIVKAENVPHHFNIVIVQQKKVGDEKLQLQSNPNIMYLDIT